MVRKLSLPLSCLLLVLAVFGALCFGSVSIDFSDTLRILGNKIPWLKDFISLEGIKSSHMTIIYQLRLPRILVALLTGASLATVGCAYQGIFKNPMADPFVIGVSSGAALGATIGIVFNISLQFLGFTTISICAFIGSLLTVFIVLKIASIKKNLPTTTLLLSGIAINYFFSAIISLLMLLNREKLEKVYLWTLGSFSASTWHEVGLILPVVVFGFMAIWLFSKDLNMMLLGDEDAGSLGVHVQRTKKIILVISSIMVAVVVSASGIIGFVGLIIPHMVRLVSGPHHQRLLPLSMLVGGLFMVLCDTLARTLLAPAELSVGIITSLFGVPFFLMLLYKSKKGLL